MKKSAHNTEDTQQRSVHADIYMASNSDFVYRKAYKGDWGDWDDLPHAALTEDDAFDICKCKEAPDDANSSPYENSFL